MDSKEFEKSYGIRIPVPEHIDYYIETIKKSNENIITDKQIELYEKFENEIGINNVKSFKYKLIEKSVSYLKPILSKVDVWECPVKFVLETKDFIPEHNKCYVSFDVKQANWSVAKYFLGLDFPSWEEYSLNVLGFPEALSFSKPLRQAILGQVVNPKRYNNMQKYLTWIHLNEIKKIDNSLYKIASINSEEIVLEITKGDNEILNLLKNISWVIENKVNVYDIKIHNNYGDNVIVKEFLDCKWDIKYKSLYSVNGHRYYIHFKSLVLEEDLDDRDMMFKQESKIFKWCGEDLKDFREWDYVKKWIKPLIWKNDDKNAYIKGYEDMIYSILQITDINITLFDMKQKEEILLPCINRQYKECVNIYHFEKIQMFIER